MVAPPINALRVEDDGSMSAWPLGPPKPMECVDGWASHRWHLSVEMGSITLSTDECRLCSDGASSSDLLEALCLDLDGRLEFDSDHGPEGRGLGGWHFDTRCDCNWWWTFVPTTISQETEGR